MFFGLNSILFVSLYSASIGLDTESPPKAGKPLIEIEGKVITRPKINFVQSPLIETVYEKAPLPLRTALTVNESTKSNSTMVKNAPVKSRAVEGTTMQGAERNGQSEIGNGSVTSVRDDTKQERKETNALNAEPIETDVKTTVSPLIPVSKSEILTDVQPANAEPVTSRENSVKSVKRNQRKHSSNRKGGAYIKETHTPNTGSTKSNSNDIVPPAPLEPDDNVKLFINDSEIPIGIQPAKLPPKKSRDFQHRPLERGAFKIAMTIVGIMAALLLFIGTLYSIKRYLSTAEDYQGEDVVDVQENLSNLPGGTHRPENRKLFRNRPLRTQTRSDLFSRPGPKIPKCNVYVENEVFTDSLTNNIPWSGVLMNSTVRRPVLAEDECPFESVQDDNTLTDINTVKVLGQKQTQNSVVSLLNRASQSTVAIDDLTSKIDVTSKRMNFCNAVTHNKEDKLDVISPREVVFYTVRRLIKDVPYESSLRAEENVLETYATDVESESEVAIAFDSDCVEEEIYDGDNLIRYSDVDVRESDVSLCQQAEDELPSTFVTFQDVMRKLSGLSGNPELNDLTKMIPRGIYADDDQIVDNYDEDQLIDIVTDALGGASDGNYISHTEHIQKNDDSQHCDIKYETEITNLEETRNKSNDNRLETNETQSENVGVERHIPVISVYKYFSETSNSESSSTANDSKSSSLATTVSSYDKSATDCSYSVFATSDDNVLQATDECASDNIPYDNSASESASNATVKSKQNLDNIYGCDAEKSESYNSESSSICAGSIPTVSLRDIDDNVLGDTVQNYQSDETDVIVDVSYDISQKCGDTVQHIRSDDTDVIVDVSSDISQKCGESVQDGRSDDTDVITDVSSDISQKCGESVQHGRSDDTDVIVDVSSDISQKCGDTVQHGRSDDTDVITDVLSDISQQLENKLLDVEAEIIINNGEYRPRDGERSTHKLEEIVDVMINNGEYRPENVFSYVKDFSSLTDFINMSSDLSNTAELIEFDIKSDTTKDMESNLSMSSMSKVIDRDWNQTREQEIVNPVCGNIDAANHRNEGDPWVNNPETVQDDQNDSNDSPVDTPKNDMNKSLKSNDISEISLKKQTSELSSSICEQTARLDQGSELSVYLSLSNAHSDSDDQISVIALPPRGEEKTVVQKQFDAEDPTVRDDAFGAEQCEIDANEKSGTQKTTKAELTNLNSKSETIIDQVQHTNKSTKSSLHLTNSMFDSSRDDDTTLSLFDFDFANTVRSMIDNNVMNPFLHLFYDSNRENEEDDDSANIDIDAIINSAFEEVRQQLEDNIERSRNEEVRGYLRNIREQNDIEDNEEFDDAPSTTNINTPAMIHGEGIGKIAETTLNKERNASARGLSGPSQQPVSDNLSSRKEVLTGPNSNLQLKEHSLEADKSHNLLTLQTGRQTTRIDDTFNVSQLVNNTESANALDEHLHTEETSDETYVVNALATNAELSTVIDVMDLSVHGGASAIISDSPV